MCTKLFHMSHLKMYMYMRLINFVMHVCICNTYLLNRPPSPSFLKRVVMYRMS